MGKLGRQIVKIVSVAKQTSPVTPNDELWKRSTQDLLAASWDLLEQSGSSGGIIMASFRGSFNAANVSPSRALRPRPLLQRRAPSSSSEASCGSASPASEDHFVFSAENTPTGEYPPSSRPKSTNLAPPTSAPRDELLYGKTAASATVSKISKSSTPQRTKPIAIEIPTRRTYVDPESAPAETPPEPLSARGDITGGYFPHHEDPKSRVHRPHPFHLDASKAKHRSLQQAAASSKSTSQVPTIREPHHFPFGAASTSAMSGSHTPVSSYLPTGHHDTAALPLGKYYPSNYEKRAPGCSSSHLHPPIRAGIVAAAKSEAQVSKLRHEASAAHSRTGSDVKRRLVQYQRDMVAQATHAARALLANSKEDSADQSDTPSPAPALPPSLGVQWASTIIKTNKPLSPRLEPLGSPGPVTPMSLESCSDGFLGLTIGSPRVDSESPMLLVEKTKRSQQTSSPGPRISA